MYHRHTDTDIISWAQYYTDTSSVLREVGEEFGVSFNSIHWNFTHRLQGIDLSLYHSVLEKLDSNKSLRGHRKNCY